MKLYEPLPRTIEMDGITYELQLHFDRVLRYMELIQSDDITAREAAEIGCEWLVTKPKNISADIGARLIEKLFKEVISPPRRMLAAQKKQPRAVDFTFDAEAIYASFADNPASRSWAKRSSCGNSRTDLYAFVSGYAA